MKRALLITLTFSVTLVAFGQYRGLPVRTSSSKMVKASQQVHPGGYVTSAQPAVPPASGFRSIEEEIGTTNFDIQTTASLGRRIGEPGNGHIGAAWQMAFEQPGFADRGTGYNHFDGSSWGPNPGTQVESSRSGYPSYTVMGNGTEVVISHKALTAGWQLISYTKAVGETTWTEHILPSDVPGGNVWAKIAAGGADGNSLHVVAITLDTAFGGTVYQGISGHPLYWRSTDGGQTWDKKDVNLPDVDSSSYLSIGAECYNIDARGETVAISIHPIFGDVLVIKSDDNGETWEKKLVYDFPLDKWDGEPYSASDLPPDPNAPDSLTTLSSDGSGTLAIDGNGNVHFFFANLYALGNTTTGEVNFALETNGISYWNEENGTLNTITGAFDWDGDGSVTLGGDIGTYRYSNSSAASFPVASIDDDGILYLVFMAFHELFTDADGLTYRHLFIIKSEDGGETWSTPFDLINEDITDEPGFIEAAFPSIPPRTGDAIQLIYQQDYIPGLTPTNGTVPDQYIMHFTLDKETFGPVSSAKEQGQLAQSMVLSPNPAHGQVQVSFELASASEVELGLYDLMGQQLSTKQLGILPSGEFRTVFSLKDLPSGVYALRVVVGGLAAVQKLVAN